MDDRECEFWGFGKELSVSDELDRAGHGITKVEPGYLVIVSETRPTTESYEEVDVATRLEATGDSAIGRRVEATAPTVQSISGRWRPEQPTLRRAQAQSGCSTTFGGAWEPRRLRCPTPVCRLKRVFKVTSLFMRALAYDGMRCDALN